MRLKSHPKPIPNTIPPSEYVAKYLLKDPRGSDHVFWCDRRANHAHSNDGQALLKWKVKPAPQTHMVSRGVYNVVRLLFHYEGVPVKNVHNVCGLPQCVNTAHWRSRTQVSAHRLVYLGGRWFVATSRTGLEVDQVTAVRLLAADGAVHIARAVPGATVTPFCGASVDLATALLVDADVTCRSCC